MSGCSAPSSCTYAPTNELPTEETHFEEYREVLQAVAPGAPVTIRTMDLGGDKNLPEVLGGGEHDSLLGLRGIRRSLGDDALFVPQVRGLLRASVYGNLRIVLPFVTELAECGHSQRAHPRDR